MKHISKELLEMVLVIASVSGVGSIAYHLHLNEKKTARQWVGSILISVVFGALVGLWLSDDLVHSPSKLLAVSAFAGIGATTIIDLIFARIVKHLEKKLGAL